MPVAACFLASRPDPNAVRRLADILDQADRTLERLSAAETELGKRLTGLPATSATDSQLLALTRTGGSVIFEKRASDGDRDRSVLEPVVGDDQAGPGQGRGAGGTTVFRSVPSLLTSHKPGAVQCPVLG